MLGRCLECAFELGPHVFPFTPSAGNAIARRRGKAGLPGSLGASGRMVMLCRKSEVSLSVSQRGSFSRTRAGFSACMHILRKDPSPQKCFVLTQKLGNMKGGK